MSSTRRLAGALLALLLARPAPAHACGGMVFPNHETRVGGMNDQELLVVFGGDETVLVASAGYEGVPAADFAFILPLGSDPTDVRDSDPALFIGLDEFSAPRISVFVDDGSSSLGLCGAGDGGAPDRGGGDDVMLHQRGRTATYEWVVIGGDTGAAVADWLSGAGYPLPPDYAAALDPYISAGRFFFAARVLPEAADGALKPIELHLPVIQPEAFEIPLALAAHSLPPDRPLGITTYFWAGGPLLPANYPAAPILEDELEATSPTETNYAALERAILDGPDGGWILDYSDRIPPDSVRWAYESAVGEGRVPVDAGDPDYITDFFGRVGTNGHLTRLRTELRADQLRDMTLRRVDGPTADNFFSVTYDPTPVGSCAVDRSGRLANFLLLVPVLAWIRPRRRRPA